MAIEKVLICDDHPVAQLGVKCMLRDFRPNTAFQFETVSTGQKALDSLAKQTPDLLTLDLHLPDISGLDVLKAVRDQKFSLKVIVLTGEKSLPLLLQILQLGADAILLKSFATASFEAAIEHLENPDNKEPYIDPQLKTQLDAELAKPQLSKREFDVLHLLLKGHTNKSIAEILKCSPETVKTLRTRIMDKTQARSRSEMSEWLYRGSEN